VRNEVVFCLEKKMREWKESVQRERKKERKKSEGKGVVLLFEV